MQVIKLNKEISLSRASAGSAGIDVQASIETKVTIYPGEKALIPLGFKMHIANPGYAAILLPRSGLGTKFGIVLANTVGLIDSDYQGEVMAVLKNTGDNEFTINPLDRIGQLVFLPIYTPHIELVDEFDNASARGEGGFGSTGVKP